MEKKLLKVANKDLLEESTLSKNDIKYFEAHFYDFSQFNTLIPNLKNVQTKYAKEKDFESSRLLSV